MKKLLIVIVIVITGIRLNAQAVNMKIVDNGGSGEYKAVVISEETLPECTVYRPATLSDIFPLIVFANGGCRNFNVEHEHLLNEIASNGYIVIALGEWSDRDFEELEQEKHNQKADTDLIVDAIDWACAQNAMPSSDYYHKIDVRNIAAMGQSCGGAQVYQVSYDLRLKTLLIMNSGMGDMKLLGTTQDLLKEISVPVLYEIGGPSDIAYKNALSDYSLAKFPAVIANIDLGHVGDWKTKNGGKFAQLAIRWFNWQLKGMPSESAVFFDNTYREAFYPDWTIEYKNF